MLYIILSFNAAKRLYIIINNGPPASIVIENLSDLKHTEVNVLIEYFTALLVLSSHVNQLKAVL